MDHDRVNISSTSMSCGVAELNRISGDDIEGVLYAIGSRLYHPSRGSPYAAFVFSDLADGEPNAATKLVKQVASLRLGNVGCTPAVENPKTGNIISIWWWNINHEVFKTWYALKRVEKLKKVGS